VAAADWRRPGPQYCRPARHVNARNGPCRALWHVAGGALWLVR